MTPVTAGAPTPRVVAHRGASEVVPEHTLAAYERAIADGADALECDVRLTADGHLVCVHDRRLDRTSNGRGVVSTKTLADLDRLDFGGWTPAGTGPRPAAPGATLDGDPVVVDESRRRVLTLERLLTLVTAAPRPVGLAIEAKHPTRYAGLVEQRIVELLRRFGLAPPRPDAAAPVCVMSFSQLSVRRMQALAPRVPTVLLLDRVPLRFRDGSLPLGVAASGPSIEVVRAHPRYVARVQSQGHEVHVWTVDEPDDVRLCVDLGVDVIITNRPGQVIEQLGRSGPGTT